MGEVTRANRAARTSNDTTWTTVEMGEVLTHARSGLETTTNEMEIADEAKAEERENKCTTTATNNPKIL